MSLEKQDKLTINGTFNGFSVLIKDADEMKKLYKTGFFGKGSLSRSFPSFNDPHGETSMVRRRIFDRHKEWDRDSLQSKRVEKVIVVPDSEDDGEYFTNFKPEYQLDPISLQEMLCLSLVEAFFLFSFVKCLVIKDQDVVLSEQIVWELFTQNDVYFIQNYAVYHHFRVKNWIVKPGMKFGCDFLLYKEGPDVYHATYSVIIDVINPTTLRRRKDLCCRSAGVINVLCLNRLCETVGKDLLICQLFWPLDLIVSHPDDFSKLFINETVLRRWIPSQNRQTVEL